MKVIIVGAGISGLSTAIALGKSGHDVLVLDSAPELAELGAGVQMTPQAIRYLFEWGLKEDLLAQSIVPEKFYVKDYKDGELLGTIPTGDMAADYGAPYILVHRAILHTILHKHAVNTGAQVRLSSRVTHYDFSNASLTLQNGEVLNADLVIAADGINSFARKELLGPLDPGSQPTGWAAIRMMADVSALKADPLTANLVDLETKSSNLWIAPNASCMTYQIKDGTMLNIVLSHRDDVDMFKYSLEQYQETVRELFKDFEPPVTRMINLSLPKIQNYPVYAVPPLPQWVHDSGRFTLIGDAAHAMAFYLSMGVSLAVEDAAALASVLNQVCHATKDNLSLDAVLLKQALQTYETARKARSTAVQIASLHAGDMAHIENGPRREALYNTLRQDGMGEAVDPLAFDKRTSYGLADRAVRDWCYNFDAVADVEAEFTRLLKNT